jgi:hypothetical protein
MRMQAVAARKESPPASKLDILLAEAVKPLSGYHLGAIWSEKIVDEGCNFHEEVSNMQTKG